LFEDPVCVVTTTAPLIFPGNGGEIQCTFVDEIYTIDSQSTELIVIDTKNVSLNPKSVPTIDISVPPAAGPFSGVIFNIIGTPDIPAKMNQSNHQLNESIHR